MALTEKQVKQFWYDGYLIIPDFADDVTMESLRTECHRLVENMVPAEHNTVFTTLEMIRTSDDYFMIRYFFEDGAKDDKALCQKGFGSEGGIKKLFDGTFTVAKIGR